MYKRIKIGDLVRYIPGASATFKWERYDNISKSVPGVVLRETDERGTTSRRFEIRWHDGHISEEWMSYLELYSV
jgi:hypothetical protein